MTARVEASWCDGTEWVEAPDDRVLFEAPAPHESLVFLYWQPPAHMVRGRKAPGKLRIDVRRLMPDLLPSADRSRS